MASGALLCALTEAVQCDYERECSFGSLEGLNLPERDGHLVLQGFERRAYSISIEKETGRLSASAVGPDVGFVIFGVCTIL